MRLTFNIKPHFSGEETHFTIKLKEETWCIWYSEQMRRFLEAGKMGKKEVQEYFKKYPVFDVDECMECEVMSPEHFEAMYNYLFKEELGKTK